MQKVRIILVRVVVSCITLIYVATQLISPVRADASSGWLSQASPQVETLSRLPSNVPPTFSNRDCTDQTYTTVNALGLQSSATDCFAQSTLGSIGLSGSPVLFNGTSLGLPITPNYPYVIQPIPNQGMMASLTSAPVNGSYLHFYRDIRQHLNPSFSIGGTVTGYTVNGEPDFSLRDKTNALMPVNALGTLSYSSNGSWMVVDTPSGSFVRVNLASFDVLPFAPSINNVGDYSSRKAATAISDDGQYAAIASNDYGYFKVYDLKTCTGTTNNNYSQPLSCESRDYWPAISSKVNGFKLVYSLRFINDDNIAMTAIYNWNPGVFYDAAKFTVTAPGKMAHSLDYLALGDSYISGEGEFQYKTGTDTTTNFCHQSPLSYPFILGTDLFNQYNSIACSGAVTNDVTNSQPQYKGQVKDNTQQQYRNFDTIQSTFSPGYLAQLSFIKKYQPRVVTLSIGGNDIGFGKIVAKCVTDNVRSRICYNSYEERMKLVKAINSAYGKLQDTYRQILKADPGVQLYVVGYPQVITQGQCGVNVQLNSADINMAQNLIAYLDWTIQQAALSTGARYVDTEHALDGHRLCEANGANVAMNGVTAGTDRGVAGVKFLGAESYHPNVLGHQLIAQSIFSHTNNLKQAMPIADTTIAAPKPTDPLALALLGNYPNTGNPTLAVVTVASGLTDEIVYRTVGTNVSIGASHGLKPNTAYQVSVDDDAAGAVGGYRTDASGNLDFNLLLPGDTSTGYHTLAITGTNIAGQTLGVYTTFYVAASPDDLDGDGIPNDQSKCVVVSASATDTDQDGIDDACDPVIGDVPVVDYSSRVYLTGNSIQITGR